MKFRHIPLNYRRIRAIGTAREWYAIQADRRVWNDENYPLPSNMKHPGVTILSRLWRIEIAPSYQRFNRYSRTRGTIIESKKKLKRLIKRRKARQYRADQKRID